MIYEISDNDFYVEATNRMDAASERRHFKLVSKTPTLLLPSELSTPARRDYRDIMMKRVKAGRIRATYCFALDLTIQGMIPLFSSDVPERESYQEQLCEVFDLVKQGQLDLRASPTRSIPSGIVTTGLAWIHRKDSSGLRTESVSVYTDGDVRSHAQPLVAAVASLPPMTQEDFCRLIRSANAVFTERVLSAAIIKRHDILAETKRRYVEAIRLEAKLCRYFGFPPFPVGLVRDDMKLRFAQLEDAHMHELREALTEVYDTHPNLQQPASSILEPAPRRVPTKPPKLLFGRPTEPLGSGASIAGDTYPMRVLEMLLWHKGEWVHFGRAFIQLPRWRIGTKRDYRYLFRKTRNKMRGELSALNEQLNARTASNESGSAAMLIEASFECNVEEARRKLDIARRCLGGHDFPRAAGMLNEIVSIYPRCMEAQELLAQCWEESEQYPESDRILEMNRVLAEALANYSKGLRAIQRHVSPDDPDKEMLVASIRAEAASLRNTLLAVKRRLAHDGSLPPQDEELYRVLRLFQQLAKPKATGQQRDQSFADLVKSPFGQDVVQKVKAAMRSEYDHGNLLRMIYTIAPRIGERTFQNATRLRNYVTKTIIHRLADERQREQSSHLPLDESLEDDGRK